MCVNIYPVWGGSSVEGPGISCMILIPTTITENTDPLNLISLAWATSTAAAHPTQASYCLNTLKHLLTFKSIIYLAELRKLYLKSRELYEANRQNQVWMRCKTKIDVEIKRVLAERSLNKLLCEETVLSPKLHLFPPHRLSPPSQQTCERCLTMIRIGSQRMIHLSAESCLLLNLGFGVLACMLVHKTLLLAICEKVLKNQVEKVEKLYQISSKLPSSSGHPCALYFRTSLNITSMSAPSRILKPQTRNISTALPQD